MTPPVLAICIPTHHGRARELDAALESVVAGLSDAVRPDVQVVVSDNGSQDETREVVERHRAELGSALVYHRFEQNVGFTRNLLRVVDSATARHCWLMGSDDELTADAVETVVDHLRADPDLTGLTVNRINVDIASGEETLDDPRVLPPPGRTTYANADEVFVELALLQDFISTQVAHRERWQAAVAELGEAGIARGEDFPHLPILFAMIRRAPRWRWVERPLLRHSIGDATLGAFGSDAFEHAVLVNTQRARIFAGQFGTGSAVHRHLMARAWVLQANTFAMIHLKYQPGHSARRAAQLLAAMTRAYWIVPRFWLQSFPVLLIPAAAIRLTGRVLRAAARLAGRPNAELGPQPPKHPYRAP